MRERHGKKSVNVAKNIGHEQGGFKTPMPWPSPSGKSTGVDVQQS